MGSVILLNRARHSGKDARAPSVWCSEYRCHITVSVGVIYFMFCLWIVRCTYIGTEMCRLVTLNSHSSSESQTVKKRIMSGLPSAIDTLLAGFGAPSLPTVQSVLLYADCERVSLVHAASPTPPVPQLFIGVPSHHPATKSACRSSLPPLILNRTSHIWAVARKCATFE